MSDQQDGVPGELDVSGIAALEGAQEFLRMWSTPQGGALCIVHPPHLRPDPFVFGMVLVDAMRHAARAWSHAVDISEEDALARILEGFDAERGHLTTDITELSGKPN